MSEIITAYPTSGLADRTLDSVNTAFYNYISTIPAVTDFFDSITKLGDDTTATQYDMGVKLTKGSSYLRAQFYATGQLRFLNNNSNSTVYTSSSAYSTPVTSNTLTVDIPISYVTGINGTTAVWLDDYSKGVCMMFNKFGDKYFLANSSGYTSASWHYSDTGSAVSQLAIPFNGDNIAKGGDVIAQPYYHYGVNTIDIYTFDGGEATIPWGVFKLGNAEFVRLYSNFALRLK